MTLRAPISVAPRSDGMRHDARAGADRGPHPRSRRRVRSRRSDGPRPRRRRPPSDGSRRVVLVRIVVVRPLGIRRRYRDAILLGRPNSRGRSADSARSKRDGADCPPKSTDGATRGTARRDSIAELSHVSVALAGRRDAAIPGRAGARSISAEASLASAQTATAALALVRAAARPPPISLANGSPAANMFCGAENAGRAAKTVKVGTLHHHLHPRVAAVDLRRCSRASAGPRDRSRRTRRMASAASVSDANSAKAKPRERPVSRSVPM